MSRIGSRPNIDDDETERPILKRIHAHGERLDDQAEEQGRLMAAVSELKREVKELRADVRSMRKANPRQLATSIGVGGIAAWEVVHEILKAMGKG